MTVDEFRRSAATEIEPAVTPPLRALWWAARGNWERAHQMANDITTPAGAWIHAHLHREEGDLSNARYWYSRAGKPEFKGSIEAERESIVSALLEGGPGEH